MLQGSVPQARQLRSEMSLPEVVLWQALRLRPGEYKFRRQHPSGPYTADFYCHEARMIIEVDGEAHARGDRPQRDAERDNWFAMRGLAVMRIAAIDILTDLDTVVRGVSARVDERLREQ